MTETILNIMKEELQSIGIPYEFMRWTSSVEYPYWIGEYTESSVDSEDGFEMGTFTLTGTTRDSWQGLFKQKATIKNHFPMIGGLRKATDTGTVVLYYDTAFPLETGEAELKRIQININAMAWKGMI